MPVVAALAPILIALLALLLIYALTVFGKILARMFPSFIPGIPGVKPRTWITSGVSALQAIIQWIIGDVIRPMVNLILTPVIAVMRWITAVEQFILGSLAEVAWIVESGIPQAVHAVRSYAHSLYTLAEHYARRIVDAAVSSLEHLIRLARSYAHSLYVAAEHYARRIVDAAVSSLTALVSAARSYAHSLYVASEHYAQRIVSSLRSDVNQSIRAVEAELSTVAGVSTSYIATQIADALKAAETQATAAVAAGISAVDIDIESSIAGLFDGLISDVGALSDVIATDLPDIGAAIRAIPRAIPTDLAGDVALSLSLAVPMLRYMRQCGIPNCRNLSSFGRFLKDLEALIGGGTFLALLVELISDPEGAAREVQGFLGPIVDDTASLARNLLGV